MNPMTHCEYCGRKDNCGFVCRNLADMTSAASAGREVCGVALRDRLAQATLAARKSPANRGIQNAPH